MRDRLYQIFILGLLTISIIASYDITEAKTDTLIVRSENFSFTSNYTLYDINNNGLNDTLELTVIIDWMENFTYDIRILINFNQNSPDNTYIDHILDFHNSNQPNKESLNYRWFSNYTGDILVKISLFQVGVPEQIESFVWESADKLQIQQKLVFDYEFVWDKNETMRNFDAYKLELTLEWQNITFANSVEINIYEFIIPSNRYLLDRSTTKQITVFGSGSSNFQFDGIRNSETNKLVQIEVISQDFEPLESEFIWEINPSTFTVIVTNILTNNTIEPINKKIGTSGSYFTQTIYFSLITLIVILTTIILRRRK